MEANFATVAAIDVGSNFIRMIIADIKADSSIVVLEDLWQPTNIGRDTFSNGRIELESIHHTCETLAGFRKVMRGYKIKEYHAVTTSGIRDAGNRDYVLAQIHSKTGLKVQVISNAEERFYLYKALRDALPKANEIRNEGSLIITIGMGGVEISVYHKGILLSTEYIKMGSLRLKQILAELEQRTLDFPIVMEEFFKSKLHFLEQSVRILDLKNCIGLGGEMLIISKLCLDLGLSKQKDFISREALNKLYAQLIQQSTEQTASLYNLHLNEAEIVLPSLIIFKYLMETTASKGIYVPLLSLRHGLVADILDEKYDTLRRKDFINDIISSVYFIGKKFGVDEVHSSQISHLSLSIFDQSYSIHLLKERERLYLQIAALLHGVGHYINSDFSHLHSYEIIRCQNIMGLSERELELIANIARYYSQETPLPSDKNYQALINEDKIMISKLVAILKLADSLDTSHTQKIKNVKLVKAKRDLCFQVESHEDILLEEWSFHNHARFFEEVMGYKPVLKHVGVF